MSRSQNKSQQIIARPRSGEGAGIIYANQEKISLNLRSLRLESEIKQSGYPSSLEEAVKCFIQCRADMLENRYEQVLLYIHLKQFGSFWQDFGFKSLEGWLADLDIPGGTTLANREVIVRLFDRKIFVLLGDDILGEMTYLVTRFQKDPEKRKVDYQNIFEAYCGMNDSFNKTEFRKIINWYVNTTYASKTIKVEDVKERPPRELPKGVQAVKVARPVAEIVIDHSGVEEQAEEEQVLPHSHLPESSMDFVIEHRLCAGCRARDAYIATLKRLIATELGPTRIPERPQDIRPL